LVYAFKIKDRAFGQFIPGRLFRIPFAQVSVQHYRNSGGRYDAPCEHAGRASAVRAQEYNWFMASSLSTGGTLPLFLCRMLISAKCIIWIVLAATAEVPVVVSRFYFLIIRYSRQFAGLLSSKPQWCVRNTRMQESD
jgi:hypothetical protein